MAKQARRGRPPGGEFAGTSKELFLRITPDLLAKVEAAARKSGRPRTQEILSRIKRTFDDDSLAIRTFGSQRNWDVMEVVAGVIRAVSKPGADWLDDSQVFDRAIQALLASLSPLRPPGRRADARLSDDVEWQILLASNWWRTIVRYGATMVERHPDRKDWQRTTEEKLAARLKGSAPGLLERVAAAQDKQPVKANAKSKSSRRRT